MAFDKGNFYFSEPEKFVIHWPAMKHLLLPPKIPEKDFLGIIKVLCYLQSEEIWVVVFLFFCFFFFKLGFTPCKAEQPLWGMELQEKEAQKV